ncbi:MAG: TonB-dependent receptor [Melioribacteraceae bacterium]|nr:TonB-dependent receptor [Melioribacteraceae bacterium]MCF8264714.1 TonB-dependent receptor [Melioribacteraceae bacterium]MCF8431372.1 TonB-dependent receptor [Melioribacteraceae bacterium]
MRRLIFSVLLLFSSLAFQTSLYSQSIIIRGKVVDSDSRLPIFNANISVLNTTLGSASDSEGRFSIIVPAKKEYELLITHIGYKKNRIILSADKALNETLLPLEKSVINLEEIPVHSSKFLTLKSENPLPLEIITSEKIQSMPAFTPSDLMENEPGITTGKDGTWGTEVTIRGLSKQKLVVLIDGNRIETSTNISAGLSLIDLNNIERIEVVKGALSSLYGSGAMGGVVNIYSKKAKYSDEFRVSGSTFSTYNSANQSGTGNLGLAFSDEYWRFNLNGTIRNAKNIRTPDGELQQSHFRDNNISLSASIRIADENELSVEFENFSATDVGIPGGAPFPQDASAKYISAKRRLISFEYIFRNISDLLNNLSIKYFNQNIDRQVELIPNRNVIINPGAEHITNGFQIQSNLLPATDHFLIFGFDAWQRSYNGLRTVFIKPSTLITEKPNPDSKFSSYGIFIQDEFKYSEKMKLIFGGRVDYINVYNAETKNPVSYLSNGVLDPSPPNQILLWEEEKTNSFSTSANIGLLYSFSEKLSLSLNLARSFRSPSLEERFQYIQLGGAVYLGNPELESEIGNFVDAGFRFASGNFSITGSLFYNSLTNLVVDQFQTSEVYAKENVGKAALYGYDFTANYSFSKDLAFYLNGAYVRGEDLENHSNLPQMPPLNFKVGVDGNLFKCCSFNFSSTIYTTQKNAAFGEQKTAGFSIYDLALSSSKIPIGLADLSFHFGIQNIFDKSYRHHLSTLRGINNLEPGRNIYIKVGLEW